MDKPADIVGNAMLEQRFDAAMHEIYERAGTELGYWATRYLQMLKRLGGIATARRLINASTTSDGYAHLRAAGRLDLTVEAYALRDEFRSLFTGEEIRRAQDRLGYYEQLAAAERGVLHVDSALAELLSEAAAADPRDRIALRDSVAAYGVAAIEPLHRWVARGNSPGFAMAVFVAIAHGHKQAAKAALWRLRGADAGWAAIIEGAIHRLG